jgi:hypothetical protein
MNTLGPKVDFQPVLECGQRDLPTLRALYPNVFNGEHNLQRPELGKTSLPERARGSPLFQMHESTQVTL